MSKKPGITPNRRSKRRGFVVKGITERHYWETWVNGDKDKCRNARQLLKRDTERQIAEATP